MNFLKISGLVIGTGSVVGGMGAGVYYGVSSKNNTEENIEKVHEKQNSKTEFVGKLVFFKKSGNESTALYGAKLLTTKQYNSELLTFNENTTEVNKYEQINKIIDISHSLNFENTKSKLDSIFGTQTNFQGVKTTILSSEEELKELFGDEIYKKIEDKFKDIN